MPGMPTGAGISPETAAGNDPSSLGSPPPVTPQGPDVAVPGQASINSLPIRATSPAIAAGGGATTTAGRWMSVLPCFNSWAGAELQLIAVDVFIDCSAQLS